MSATPRTVRAARTMTRIRQADQAARELAARRRATTGKGYHGPLTRAELARLADLNAAGHR
jgi:hypothetical protein